MRNLFETADSRQQAAVDMGAAPRGLARRADPATSKAAAAQVAPRVSGQCQHILALIKQYPDCTAGELSVKPECDVDYHTVAKRVSVLDDRGLIEVNNAGRECSVRHTHQRTYRACPETRTS